MGFIGRIVALIAMLVVPASAWAIHPFQVETTDTRGRGNFLLELNYDYRKDDGLKETAQTGILTLGAGERTDFSVEVPYLILDPGPAAGTIERGIGDVQVSFKQRVYDNEVKQSVAYKLYINAPIGDHKKGLGEDHVFWGITLVDQQVCHNNVLHASGGYEVGGRGDAKWFYGLAAELVITGRFRLLTELAGEIGKNTNSETGVQTHLRPWTFMAGFKYDITKWWYVDLAARAGLNNDAEDYTALAGTAFKF